MLSRIRQKWSHFRLLMSYARHLGRRDHERVLAVGERVLLLRPDDALVLTGMAQAKAALGDHDDARQLWLRALEVEPDSFEILSQLGRSFAVDGDDERAYPFVKRALESAPALPQPLDQASQRLDRLGGFLLRRRGHAERQRRRHQKRQEYLRKWVDWAGEYAEWCEAVLALGRETIN